MIDLIEPKFRLVSDRPEGWPNAPPWSYSEFWLGKLLRVLIFWYFGPEFGRKIHTERIWPNSRPGTFWVGLDPNGGGVQIYFLGHYEFGTPIYWANLSTEPTRRCRCKLTASRGPSPRPSSRSQFGPVSIHRSFLPSIKVIHKNQVPMLIG